MFGISSYRDIESWEKMHPVAVEGINWCFILLGNQHNATPALKLIFENFNYLNRRTKDIRYFVPGCIVNEKGLQGDLRKRFEERFDFYEEGFLDTIDWLENGCANYSYKEDMEMILLPYYKKTVKPRLRRYGSDECELREMVPIPSLIDYSISPKITYDFDHMIWYNLDNILKEGKNILSFITNGVEIAHKRLTPEETRLQIEQILGERKKTHKVFIAGSKALGAERDGIRSIFSQLSNKEKINFEAWTYEDFGRSFVSKGQQNQYNTFIKEEADSVIFVINDKVGGITKNEFDIAVESFKKLGRPQIYLYCNESGVIDEDVKAIIDTINELGQYYIDYNNLNDLKNQVWRDYSDIMRE